MLVDTGSDRTMVAVDCINLAKVESTDLVPVVCVHGDNFLPHSCSATTDWDLAVAGLSSSSTRVACGRAPGMRFV